jgi:4-hydroxybenzoate polyprenyltransferase
VTPRRRPLHHLRELLEMIKFQHALFALPFALTGMVAAAGGWPEARVVALSVACVVAARTAAMTWNRIADRGFDARNPRTADRALPAGRVSLRAAWTLLVASVAAFLAAAAAINRLTLLLAPVALLVVLGYSLTKRFTWGTHFVLGLALALAPVGAWVAVRGRLEWEALLLGAAVTAWTAGFDLLHACQDQEFDRAAGLHSIPARFGVPAALWTARGLHVLTVVLLAGFGVALGWGLAYFAALAAAAGILGWSHSLVSPGDLRRVGLAFFQANATVSLVVLAGTAIEVLLLGKT